MKMISFFPFLQLIKTYVGLLMMFFVVSTNQLTLFHIQAHFIRANLEKFEHILSYFVLIKVDSFTGLLKLF